MRRLTLRAAVASDLRGIFGAFPPTLKCSMGFRIGGNVSRAFLRAWNVTFNRDRLLLLVDRADRQPRPGVGRNPSRHVSEPLGQRAMNAEAQLASHLAKHEPALVKVGQALRA